MRFEFVNNRDTNDNFEIVANSLDSANTKALIHLGYTISPLKQEGNSLTVYECNHTVKSKSFNLSSDSPEEAVKTAISELGWDIMV